ncbi:hypothetical protein ACRE_047430 [Hapsidospora chrysogenum ATCC 11550]|uniref:Nineteen complex-related protein 2-domain-containing protein n=1 Tax=Hapsidospora chrysogenum (strain ATCC 11550 / CBS 779.69 / DSM 880 / IAM 14645 / JCM 23072 / IMI 49137) TaxID=857340 RepID=A0A086T524_HAPC1|nr:hypothetical protein ACRE_047430 [Hapsidospora chrysogenum ATCC 11550]
MSSFGAKRKARVIKVSDEDDPPGPVSSSDDGDALKTEPLKPVVGSKSGRKPFRQSGLRKTFTATGDEGADNTSKNEGHDDEDDDGPVVVRPTVSRNSSTSQKKRPLKSKLSFGGDTGDGGDEGGHDVPVKKAPLGKRALENSAAKRGISTRGLPVRSFQDEEDRPKYSKEYLNELQSSTPNTPAPLDTNAAEEMDLDVSELEGALVVDSPGIPASKQETTILTDAEIRERKERRARLAKEQEFLSVEDDDDDDDRLGRKKKDDTRLKAEDEDLGEGFDEYVEDGGLSLGKRAEKERRKRERQQMAELITAAEGHSSDASSDSEAERRMAYEAAQSRAGMDGLKKPRKDPAEELLRVPPKIAPLPSLSECIQKLQVSLRTMENDLKGKEARVRQLRSDKEEISKREAEVQALLDETGKKYQEAMGKGKVEDATVKTSGPGAQLVGERGLESIGTTPRRAVEEDEP